MLYEGIFILTMTLYTKFTGLWWIHTEQISLVYGYVLFSPLTTLGDVRGQTAKKKNKVYLTQNIGAKPHCQWPRTELSLIPRLSPEQRFVVAIQGRAWERG